MISGEVASHRAKLSNVVVPESDSLNLDSQSIVELLLAAERVGRVYTAISERSGTTPSIPLVPAND